MSYLLCFLAGGLSGVLIMSLLAVARANELEQRIEDLKDYIRYLLNNEEVI
jgi:hypothetical protein